MRSAQTLESRLILTCARTDAESQFIRDLVDGGPDWQVILRKAERLGLACLLHTNLRDAAGSGCVPKAVWEHLRRLSHREAIASLTVRDGLRSLLPQLSAAGLPVIVLKDAALASLVYQSPELRPVRSADLLVHRQDVAKVDGLLRSIGYVLETLPRGLPTRAYVRTDGFAPVRIYDHLAGPNTNAVVSRISIADFWGRCRPAEIESAATLVFSYEDLLLHLTLDLARDRRRAKLQTLCDIAEVCRQFGGAINWSHLVAHAAEYKVSKRVYYSLGLARDLLGAAIPPHALKDLRASFFHLPCEGKLIPSIGRRGVLAEGPHSSPRVPAVRSVIDRMDGWRRKAGSLRARFRRTMASHVLFSPRNDQSSDAGEVAVTYDTRTANEGVGAQLQRIYGLYALSRALRIKYVHTPMRRVDYQGFLPLISGRTEPNFADRYNTFFSLPSDDFDLEHCQRFAEGNLSEDKVKQYRQLAASTGRPVLLEVLTPYGYTDEHPAAYLALREVTPYRGYRATGPVRICIHVRRGDNALVRPDQKDRLLPNSYYIRVCSSVADALRRQGSPFIVRLHTEMPLRSYTLHPGIPGIQFNMDQSSTIGPEQYLLEEFETLPNLEFVLNGEAKAALDDFGTADILIISMSSFSYLGGLLNPHGLVIYAPFWHAPLPHWLVANERGELNARELEVRIAKHLRRRGQA